MTPATIAAGVAAAADYTGELFVIGGVALAGVLGWVGTIIAKKLRDPMKVETLWEQIDTMRKTIYGDEKDPNDNGLLGRVTVAERRADGAERKAGAMGRVIRDLARQWKGEPPRLNPSDLDEIDEDTLPLNDPWRVKP